jgi:ubiquinone/menaquinone biosynthesis C-methylase UbiE
MLKQYAQDGDTILDVGCGDGRLIELFDGMDVAFTGVDLSQAFIDLAQKQYPHGEYLVADMAKELPFADGSFDKIYTIAAVNHIPPSQQKHTFVEFARVLKPGGTLVMRNWNLYNEWVQAKVAAGKYTKLNEHEYLVPWRNGPGEELAERYYYAFTMEQLDALLTEAGFIVQQQLFTKKGGKVAISQGENIVTIATR